MTDTPELTGEKHIYKTTDEGDLALYVYTPEGHTPEDSIPAIVFYHGGGWRQGSPSQFEPHCRHLASRGMVAVTVQYRLMTDDNDIKAEQIIEDARSAMRWVRGNAEKLGINPDMIAAAGGSAGGHLAASVMLIDEFNAETDDTQISTEPNLMVLFNPAIARGPHPLFSDEFNKQAEEHFKGRCHGPVEKVSPLTYVEKKQPPCIMYFGTEDRLLYPAEVFCEESKKAGNECSIVLYKGQGHAFFNYGKSENKYYDLTLAETDKFLVKHGFLKEK